jgi:hypothetical protein
MNIRHDRHLTAALAQPGDNVLEIGRVFHRRRSDAHDLAANRRKIKRLLDGRRGVHRVAGDHRLDADRIRAAEAHVAHAHLAGGATLVVIRRGAITGAAHWVSGDL